MKDPVMPGIAIDVGAGGCAATRRRLAMNAWDGGQTATGLKLLQRGNPAPHGDGYPIDRPADDRKKVPQKLP